MKLIQVVPDQPYFAWQLLVQMYNFREHGIEQDAVVLVATGGNNGPSKWMKEFESWTKATVIYYKDERKKRNYLSSIRPHLLAKYFKDHPTPVFFYHDQDIIFIEKPRLDELANDDICYVSAAAKGYTDAGYLKLFKPYQFPSMAAIVGIPTSLIEANDAHCGGAQYIMKGMDNVEWWEKVERDCEGLYTYLQDVTTRGLTKYNPDEVLPSYHIQIWCTDMWVVLWNMWLIGKEVRHHDFINFCTPNDWKSGKDPDNPNNVARPIMHNAGIDGSNEDKVLYDVLDANGKIISASPVEKFWADKKVSEVPGSSFREFSRKREYFNKSRYNGEVYPFEDNFDFVSADRVQHHYVSIFKQFKKNTMTQPEKRRFKVLGIFCTTNNIHPDLLKLSLSHVRKAKEAAQDCDVEINTVSWKEIPDNPFPNQITPYNGLGHLNYLLQLKQGLFFAKETPDIICILEHDVLYPDNYFDEIANNWSPAHYGVCNNNYIGMNQTGYCDVVQRHQPMSLMSFARTFFESLLDQKVNEVVKSIGHEYQKPGGPYPFGWTCVEPDDKNLMYFIEFSNVNPVIHVNMNTTNHRHHFTGHADVCYEQNSNGKTFREDWGDYKQYFTFS